MKVLERIKGVRYKKLPTKIAITKSQFDILNRLGVSVEDFAKAVGPSLRQVQKVKSKGN